MYRFFGGNKNWTIVMGGGPTILRLNRIVINTFFLCGYVDINSDGSVKSVRRFHAFLWSIGGSLVNLIFTVSILLLLYFLRSINPVEDYSVFNLDRILRIACMTNIYCMIIPLIPITYPFAPLKGMPSDGLRILRLINYKEVKD